MPSRTQKQTTYWVTTTRFLLDARATQKVLQYAQGIDYRDKRYVQQEDTKRYSSSDIRGSRRTEQTPAAAVEQPAALACSTLHRVERRQEKHLYDTGMDKVWAVRKYV